MEVVSDNSITVVVVTYGDRWHLLEKNLHFLEKNALVEAVVVVDNASVDDIKVKCLEHNLSKPIVLRMKSNLGSAGGFSIGLEYAYKLSSMFILLLDDDVVPCEGSLHQLLSTYHRIRKNSTVKLLALTAFRESQFKEKFMNVRPFFLEEHHYMGLNVFNFHQRHFFKFKFKPIKEATPELISRLRGTAYAGLLLTKEVVQEIGYPNKDFIVYYDDVEYASRILRKGGQIWLDPDSEFEDIYANFSRGVIELAFLGILTSDSEMKIYYMVRNHIYLDRHVYEKKSFYFYTNLCVFILAIVILAVFMFKFKRLSVFFDGLRDGWAGRLGRNSKYQLL